MEGFEGNNNKSKTAIKHHSNGKGNLITQIILSLTKKIVWDKVDSPQNNVLKAGQKQLSAFHPEWSRLALDVNG